MLFPVFLSVVFVVRNQVTQLEGLLARAAGLLESRVSDYELIVVDNASDDDSVVVLKALTGEQGLPNLQIYALTQEVDLDTASWVGLENALGDFVAVIDPLTDDIGFLPIMLEKAVSGADVVFARYEILPERSIGYRVASSVFQNVFRWFNGIHLGNEAPQFRILNKRVVNFILQHPQPAMTYRHLPARAGFARANLTYGVGPMLGHKKKLRDSIDRGIQLIVSTTRGPMRLVTALSLFGAVANLLYSFYVVAIALFKPDVASGWVSLSLQQSGMFLLISLVLLVLGEYILNMASLSSEGPLYHVGQEFTSARMTRRDKLNIEDVGRVAGSVEAEVDRQVS
jgi:polyisoprenyl-phosphate glycosyltransferase